MCLYEYNQEEHMKFVREEGLEQGKSACYPKSYEKYELERRRGYESDRSSGRKMAGV